MQKIIISGNIGSDATLTAGQRPQYRFSVGVNNGKDENGEKDTVWYSVFAYPGQWLDGRLLKGTKVTIIGNLKPGIYVGNDGLARLDLTISADTVELHDSPQAQAQPQGGYTAGGGRYNPALAAGAAVAAQGYRQPTAAPAPVRGVVARQNAQQPQADDLPL